MSNRRRSACRWPDEVAGVTWLLLLGEIEKIQRSPEESNSSPQPSKDHENGVVSASARGAVSISNVYFIFVIILLLNPRTSYLLNEQRCQNKK